MSRSSARQVQASTQMKSYQTARSPTKSVCGYMSCILNALSVSIEAIRAAFPFWDALDAFWCELPNYNSIAVSSAEHEHDRDHESIIDNDPGAETEDKETEGTILNDSDLGMDNESDDDKEVRLRVSLSNTLILPR
jgi:hypothetical protein